MTVISRQGFGLHLAYKAHLAMAGKRGQVITAAVATTGAVADEVQGQTEGADSALADDSSDDPEAGGTGDEEGDAYSRHSQGSPFSRDQMGSLSAGSPSRPLGQQSLLDEYSGFSLLTRWCIISRI